MPEAEVLVYAQARFSLGEDHDSFDAREKLCIWPISVVVVHDGGTLIDLLPGHVKADRADELHRAVVGHGNRVAIVDLEWLLHSPLPPTEVALRVEAVRSICVTREELVDVPLVEWLPSHDTQLLGGCVFVHSDIDRFKCSRSHGHRSAQS